MSRRDYGAPVNEIRLDDLPVYLQMKMLRTLSGISALDMARRWGKSQAYVYRVERGQAEPTPLEIRDAREVAAATYARAVATAIEAVAASAEAESLRVDAPDGDEDPPGGGARRPRPSA